MSDPSLILTAIGLGCGIIGSFVAIYVKLASNIAATNARQESHEKHCEDSKEVLQSNLQEIRSSINTLLSRQ